MKKTIYFLAFLITLFLAVVAQAATVTDTHWGVDKENVLRFVVDLTDQANYQTDLSATTLTITVDAELQKKAAGNFPVNSSLANSMQVSADGKQTVLRVSLKKLLTSADIKSFVLKKDPQTGRPARIVFDLTADKNSAATVKPAAPAVNSKRAAVAAAGGTVQIGNKPIKSSSATAPTASANQSSATASKQTSSTPATGVSSQKNNKSKTAAVKEEVKTQSAKKAKTAKAGSTAAVRGSGKYSTGGGIKDKVITIDAGHGGSDPGAIGPSGSKEKNITLAIAKKIQANLKDKGAKAQMTRTSDVDVHSAYAKDVDELQARVNIAEKNNSDIFISIHVNSSTNKKIGGISTYYFPKSNHDKRLATHIQNKLAKNFGLDNMGVRQANFYVIKRCTMPAVLIELCFISKRSEEKLLNGSWFQNKAAKLIAEAIEEYFK